MRSVLRFAAPVVGQPVVVLALLIPVSGTRASSRAASWSYWHYRMPIGSHIVVVAGLPLGVSDFTPVVMGVRLTVLTQAHVVRTLDVVVGACAADVSAAICTVSRCIRVVVTSERLVDPADADRATVFFPLPST